MSARCSSISPGCAPGTRTRRTRVGSTLDLDDGLRIPDRLLGDSPMARSATCATPRASTASAEDPASAFFPRLAGLAAGTSEAEELERAASLVESSRRRSPRGSVVWSASVRPFGAHLEVLATPLASALTVAVPQRRSPSFRPCGRRTSKGARGVEANRSASMAGILWRSKPGPILASGSSERRPTGRLRPRLRGAAALSAVNVAP